MQLQSSLHYLDDVSSHIESLSEELRQISLSIHDHPELQYKEFHAHRVLTEYLSTQAGWEVTPSAYNIETAFVAVFDTGREGPVVSFNAEYGMLPLKAGACGRCTGIEWIILCIHHCLCASGRASKANPAQTHSRASVMLAAII